MLNLALMMLTASSIERRITVMQRPRSLPASLGMMSVLATAALLALACSSTRPHAVEPKRDAVDETEAQLQKAASKYYGDVASPGDRKLIWFVFDHDWTVRKHDIGAEDAVEADQGGPPWSVNIRSDSGGSEAWKGHPRPWSVNASLAKKSWRRKGPDSTSNGR